jgi:hypothetical protein
MPSRNESMRAFERLRLSTPLCDDASLVKLEEDAAEYLRKAKHRDASDDELISTVFSAHPSQGSARNAPSASSAR